MRKLLCFVLCLLSSTLALEAKKYAIRIPRQHWMIVVDTPPLTPGGESDEQGGYAYRANSGTFNLSLFVEQPAVPHGGNKACYDFYWAKSSQNPLIRKDTVKVTHTDAYYRVEYIIDADPGTQVRNVNYFFAYRDRWVDVHISVLKPTAADEATFANFDRALQATSEGGGAPAKGGTGLQVLRLSESDALSIAVPPQWSMGVVETPTEKFPFVTFPFYPKDGRKAAFLLTVFSRYNSGDIKPELLREILVGDSKALTEGTADKKMPPIREINFPHGRGLFASFIDASLIGKAPKPNDYKVTTCYMLSVQGVGGDYLLKVSVLCDDLNSSENREAEAIIKSLAGAQ